MKSLNGNHYRVRAFSVPIVAAAALAGCGGDGGSGPAGSGSGPGTSITVTTPADLGRLQPGDTAQVAATVSNDTANRGVTWTVSCPAAACGTVSPAATASDTPTTYTAPASVAPGQTTVSITATSVSDTTASASTTVAVTAITVSVQALGSTVVPFGTTTQFTATVANDPANRGVNWTVACAGGTGVTDCGKISPISSASGAAVTYTAPAKEPSFTLTANITASSVSAPASWGVLSVNVPPLTISMTPLSALMPLNVSQEFAATVSNDPSANGVIWTLSQDGTPCTAGCGSVSPSPTANGAVTTYTAPALVPANPAVSLTAASVTDPSASVTAQVTVTAGSVKLIPMKLGWGKQTRGHAQVVTLTNTGISALTIGGISIGGTNPGDFSQTNTCGNSLAAAASCTISVVFSPKSGGASRTAVLSISDSSSDSPQRVDLAGSLVKAVTTAMRAALAGQMTAAVPRPTGGSQVGTRTMQLVDPGRADPYLSNGAHRELMVRFWYPTSLGTLCNAADYTSPRVWSYFSQLLGVALPQVSTNSCLDAPVADGPHPVVVFSPGFTGTFTDYTFLLEDLASRGYVVAAVDHTYDATAVEFPDGRLEKSVFGSHLSSYTRSDAQALSFAASVRLADMKFVLDQLQRLATDRGGPLAGRLDLSRIALAGHSLGGLTTISGLQNDPRIKAGVVLDGLMPDQLSAPIQTPLLMLAAGRERWNEDDCRLWTALRGSRMAVNLRGAEHITPSDAVWLLRGIVQTGTASPEQAVAAMRDYVAAFLDANLASGSAVPAMSQAPREYPDAAVVTRDQLLCNQQ